VGTLPVNIYAVSDVEKSVVYSILWCYMVRNHVCLAAVALRLLTHLFTVYQTCNNIGDLACSISV
jgi:hypothetical protein